MSGWGLHSHSHRRSGTCPSGGHGEIRLVSPEMRGLMKGNGGQRGWRLSLGSGRTHAGSRARPGLEGDPSPILRGPILRKATGSWLPPSWCMSSFVASQITHPYTPVERVAEMELMETRRAPWATPRLGLTALAAPWRPPKWVRGSQAGFVPALSGGCFRWWPLQRGPI